MPLLRAACVRNIALTAVQQYVLRSSALAPYTIQVRGWLDRPVMWAASMACLDHTEIIRGRWVLS